MKDRTLLLNFSDKVDLNFDTRCKNPSEKSYNRKYPTKTKSYKRKSNLSLIQQVRYFHAKQIKHRDKETKGLKTYLGCVKRDREKSRKS